MEKPNGKDKEATKVTRKSSPKSQGKPKVKSEAKSQEKSVKKSQENSVSPSNLAKSAAKSSVTLKESAKSKAKPATSSKEPAKSKAKLVSSKELEKVKVKALGKEKKPEHEDVFGKKRAVAHVKHIRISPRKVTVVLDLIRSKPVKLAMAILKYTPKAACEYLIKLLKSASANAENNNHMDPEKLYVSECFVAPGPILKRSRAKDHGRCHRIEKRSSHVTIALKERVESD